MLINNDYKISLLPDGEGLADYMNTFVLKSKQWLLGFEVGFFNLFALIVLLPIFYLPYLTANFFRCCNSNSLDLFYQGNLTRIYTIALSFLICNCLEWAVLSALKTEKSSQRQGAYVGWMFVRTLPVLLLLLAAIALPVIQLVYWFVGMVSVGVLLGPDSVKYRWAPAFSWPGQALPIRRHHLNKIALYLGGFYLFILVGPSLFSSYGECDCSKISSVKANMHTLQTIVETYAIDNQGKYPQSLDILKQDALQKGREYWKETLNPFNHRSGLWLSYAQLPGENLSFGKEKNSYGVLGAVPYLDVLGIPIYHESFARKAASPGLVIYEPVSPTRYYIYGLGKDGTFIFDKGAPLTLSNS